MKKHTYEIRQIDTEKGTMVVRWDRDENLVWNYNIPIDPDTGKSLKGQDFKVFMAETGFRVYQEQEARSEFDHDAFRAENLRKEVDISKEVDELSVLVRVVADDNVALENLR